MIHVLHLSPDLDRQTRQRLMLQDSEPAAIAEARRLLELPGAYIPVAAMETEDPEAAWAATNNGGAIAWSIIPPPGLFPLRPRLTPRGTPVPARSTSMGDVLHAGGQFHLVVAFGFAPLGIPSQAPRLPDPDRRLHDAEGRRLHMTAEEQHAIVEAVAKRVLAAGVFSHEAAEAALAAAGASGRHALPIAEHAVALAAQRWPGRFRLSPAALACCITELERSGLTPPSPAALAVSLAPDPVFCERLNHFHRSPEDRLDTVEREWLLGHVARRLAGREWPVNGDDPREMEAFVAALVRGAERAGWRLGGAFAREGGGPSP